MQGISEQDEAGETQLRVRGGDLRGDPSAHGFAADDQAPPRALHLRAHTVDDRPITTLEHRRPIRDPPALLGVEKIERDDVDAQRGQRARKIDHERAALSRAGTVPQNQRGADGRDIGPGGASGGIDERRGRVARLQTNGELTRTFQGSR